MSFAFWEEEKIAAKVKGKERQEPTKGSGKRPPRSASTKNLNTKVVKNWVLNKRQIDEFWQKTAIWFISSMDVSLAKNRRIFDAKDIIWVKKW